VDVDHFLAFKGSLLLSVSFAAKTTAKDVFSGDKGEEGIFFF